MAYSPEIKSYAKDMYLLPNEDGTDRKYSTRQVSDKIQQDFNIKVHHSTIAEWAKKGEWEKLWIKGVRAGFLEAAEKESEEDRLKEQTQEEKIRTAITKSVSNRRIKIIQMLAKADRYYLPDEKKQELLEKGEYIPTNPTEAFNLWRYCMEELKDMEDRDEIKVNVTGQMDHEVKHHFNDEAFMKRELEFAKELLERRRGGQG